jgi:hypothetical protein
MRFTFTFLFDFGTGGTLVSRYSGANEDDAREVALSALPDAKKERVRSIKTLAIDYGERKAP